MKLVVFSHKVCWNSRISPVGYATDGGFVFHMQALASSFDKVYLLVPISRTPMEVGEIIFTDKTIQIIPLKNVFGKGLVRKLLFPFWFLFHSPIFIKYLLKSDVVHAPIPGDIGTIAMLLAPLFNKKIFVRYCGNWKVIKTLPEKFWVWYGEKLTKKNIAYLTTGGDIEPPSKKNKNIKWIFSSSMLQNEINGFSQKDFDIQQTFKIAIGGRLIKEKGFGITIEAIARLINEIKSIQLVIYGEGPDRKIFEERVKQLGLTKNVVFLGKLSATEVHKVLGEIDIFCFPTYSSEGFPKAVIEAMAHGVPIISTDVSVIPNLISNTHKPAGLIVDKQNVDQLVNALKFYFEHPNIHVQHAHNAKEIACDYSLERWIDTMNEILNNQWASQIYRKKVILK
jgi:glycosyltransferase involved in cell wall biosynthesis